MPSKDKDKKRAERLARQKKEERLAMGKIAAEVGVKVTAKYNSHKIHVVKYWRKKYLEPNWHNGSHGGRRREFSAQQTAKMCAVLRSIVDARPATPLRYYRWAIWLVMGLWVSITWIRTTFQDVGWTYVAKPLDRSH